MVFFLSFAMLKCHWLWLFTIYYNLITFPSILYLLHISSFLRCYRYKNQLRAARKKLVKQKVNPQKTSLIIILAILTHGLKTVLKMNMKCYLKLSKWSWNKLVVMICSLFVSNSRLMTMMFMRRLMPSSTISYSNIKVSFSW